MPDEWMEALLRGDLVAALGAEKAERLTTIIQTRGVAAGGFILNLRLEDGGHASFVFDIIRPRGMLWQIRRAGKIAFTVRKPVVMAHAPGEIPELPEDVRRYPVWWID